jgi:hypothetical protein
MRQGRPICWLVVVIAVAMSVMPWGTAQAGPIKWSGEGYAPWRLGDPGEPDGGKSRRYTGGDTIVLVPVSTGMATVLVPVRVSDKQLRLLGVRVTR